MTLDTFFQKFDQFADAPGAVGKLRELVFELAVHGKLVDQQLSDGTAVQLLSSISKERDTRTTKLRTPDAPASADGNEPAFPIPTNWAWTKLGTIALQIQYGYTASADSNATEIRMLRITDIQNNRVDWPTVPGCQIEMGEAVKYLLSPNDILIARTGGTIGKSFIVPDAPVKSVFASYLIRVTPPKSIAAQYLKTFLESPLYWSQLRQMSAGTGQPNVNGQALGRLEIPLPPLAEQQRIVAKVEELLGLCDRLEAEQAARTAGQAALGRAALSRFADAPTPANLEFIFHRSYAIPPADLRKAILTLAVCGKLTPPAPDDTDLPSLDEFRGAAASLSNLIGLRIPKESVEEASPYFEAPNHWRWMTLADIGAAQTGSTPSKNDHDAFNGDIPFIKPADILPNQICYSNESLTRHGAVNGSRLAPNGSLLMVCIGTIGKCNLIEQECAFNQQINSLTPVEWVDSRYLLIAARAPYFQIAAWEKSSTTTIPILNKGKWVSIAVPIPPLAEQRRIVAKVEQLMGLVDGLESQMAAARASGANLLSALVAELTGTANTTPAATPTSAPTPGRRGRPRKTA